MHDGIALSMYTMTACHVVSKHEHKPSMPRHSMSAITSQPCFQPQGIQAVENPPSACYCTWILVEKEKYIFEHCGKARMTDDEHPARVSARSLAQTQQPTNQPTNQVHGCGCGRGYDRGCGKLCVIIIPMIILIIIMIVIIIIVIIMIIIIHDAQRGP